MEISGTFFMGAVLLGISVDMALGIAGYGNDQVATLLASSGVDPGNAGRASTALFGFSSAGAAWFMALGYNEDRIGRIV